MSTVSTRSSMHSSTPFQIHDEEHDVWNPVLELCCHYHVGKYTEEILTEEEIEVLALSCRFALDPFLLPGR